MPSDVTILWALCGLAAVAWVVRLIPKRVGRSPRCPKCDYLIVGEQSGRCSECGAEVNAFNIRFGQRRPRRAATAVLALCLIAAGVYATRIVRTTDWYQWRQVEPVLKDARSNDPTAADRAWRELNRRRDEGKLPPAAENELAEIALATHAKTPGAGGPLEGELLAYLMRRHNADTLTPDQTRRLYEQQFRPVLRLRPVIVAGDELPVDVEYKFHRGGSWMLGVLRRTVTVDGQTMSDWSIGDYNWMTTFRLTKPGTYTVRVREDCEIDLRPFGTLPPAGPKFGSAWTFHTDLQAEVRVVDRDPGDLVKFTNDPAFGQMIQTELGRVKLTRGDGQSFHVAMDFVSVPTDIAFDVIVRADGREYPAGELVMKRGRSRGLHREVKELTRVPVKRVDVIFRPSPTAARRTPDILTIWGSEVVIGDVKITQK